MIASLVAAVPVRFADSTVITTRFIVTTSCREVFERWAGCKSEIYQLLTASETLCFSTVILIINQWDEIDLTFDLSCGDTVSAVEFFCSPDTLTPICTTKIL